MNDNVLKRYLYTKKIYKDPDGYGNVPDYYKEYCDLLNNRSKYIGNPKNIEYVLEKEKKGGYSIVIKKDGTKSIKMKSDQFGFSFAALYSNKFHPYDAYLLLFDDKDLEKKIKIAHLKKLNIGYQKRDKLEVLFCGLLKIIYITELEEECAILKEIKKLGVVQELELAYILNFIFRIELI